MPSQVHVNCAKGTGQDFETNCDGLGSRHAIHTKPVVQWHIGNSAGAIQCNRPKPSLQHIKACVACSDTVSSCGSCIKLSTLRHCAERRAPMLVGGIPCGAALQTSLQLACPCARASCWNEPLGMLTAECKHVDCYVSMNCDEAGNGSCGGLLALRMAGNLPVASGHTQDESWSTPARSSGRERATIARPDCLMLRCWREVQFGIVRQSWPKHCHLWKQLWRLTGPRVSWRKSS